MTEYTFDTNLYSDFYKETYGFRPRNDNFYHPDTTDDQRQDMWDSLLDSHRLKMANEEERKAIAIRQFEKSIDIHMGYGASDRETAIRWILDGLDDPYDAGYVCYQLGLPYSFESQFSR
jgi:hypothetical protein